MKSLMNFFKEAQEIIVKEDTYAALYATVDTEANEKAIVCILGTGSNCSYYNGHDYRAKSNFLRVYPHG